jgi:hypothetical protein
LFEKRYVRLGLAIWMSQDILVDILAILPAEWTRRRGLIPYRGKGFFFSLQRPECLWRQQATDPKCIGGSFPGSEVIVASSFAFISVYYRVYKFRKLYFTSTYVLMRRRLVEYRDNILHFRESRKLPYIIRGLFCCRTKSN